MKHTFILVWKFILKKLIALRDSHLCFSVAGRVGFKLLGGTSTKTFSLNWWWIYWTSCDTARGVNWYNSGAGTQVNVKIYINTVNRLNRTKIVQSSESDESSESIEVVVELDELHSRHTRMDIEQYPGSIRQLNQEIEDVESEQR